MATTQMLSLKVPAGGGGGGGLTPIKRASLYVGDLDPQVTELDLKNVFSSMGSIYSLRLCRCSLTGRSLCYAYVNFCSPYDAYRALCFLNHAYLKGKPMRLMWCERNPCARKSGIGNLYVKNLDASIDSARLNTLFSQFGTVLSCKVVEEHGKSKGYGFVQFDSEDSALAARTALHDTTINDKKLYVSRFVKKSERTVAPDCEELKFTNLYVKNLADNMTQNALRDMFSEFGEVTSAVIIKDHNGKSRGFGFVNFKSPEDARKAVDALNGSQLDSRTLFVGRAQKKAERMKILQQEYKDIFKNHMANLKASNLYVKNLGSCIDDNTLKELFSTYGRVVSAKVMRNNSGASRGFGFVCFSSPEEAKKALNSLNGNLFQGRSLCVSMAQCKSDHQLELQKYFPQSLYLSDNSIAPPPICPLYQNFYPYPLQVPFQPHTFSNQNFGANPGVQYPCAAQSYYQRFYAYIPMAEMHQGSQKSTYQSCQPSAVKHATLDHFDRDLNSAVQTLGYKKIWNIIGGAACGNPRRSLAAGKSKKVIGNRCHPHVENLQPERSANTAGMLSEISNSRSSNSSGLQADRAAHVLKEVNILKSADAGAAALPKTATCRSSC